MEQELDYRLNIGIHYYGAQLTQALQKELWPYKRELVAISSLGDPYSAYVVMFPLLVCLKKSLGRRVLWSACIAEWLNIVFKWLLDGQRPYWWQFVSGEWRDNERLRQVSLTCETGPGSPSGHCMISAAVWYIMAHAAASLLHKSSRWIPYSFFWLALALVSISRVFIATHFPHQVLLGSVVGVLVAKAFLSKSMKKFADSKILMFYVSVAGVLVALAYVCYYVLLGMGVDPSRSVQYALKYCADRDWVHLNTTPFFSLFRMSGSLVGLGVARHAKIFPHKSKFLPSRLLVAVVCVLYASYCATASFSIRSTALFYALSFLQYVFLPITVAIICRILSKILM